MKIKTIFLSLLITPFFCTAQEKQKVSDDIVVTKLSDKAYVYVATAEIEGFGNVPSNGLILVDQSKAMLLDTPVNDEQTEALVNWIESSLQAKVTGFIPNHWHLDCMGGLAYLQKRGVKSYANQMTIDMAKKMGKPVPEQGFKDSLTVVLGDMDVKCYYLGGGHSTDNIVVWIPVEKILFGGCMVKDCNSSGLGNTEDAAVDEWPYTIDRIMKKFPDARYVIPGHGEFGGTALLKHTRSLFEE